MADKNVCDGVPQCMDHSDEAHCEVSLNLECCFFFFLSASVVSKVGARDALRGKDTFEFRMLFNSASIESRSRDDAIVLFGTYFLSEY